MGTFVMCRMDDSLHVPEELRERYLSQMETLFRQSGMMTCHETAMYGFKLRTMDLQSNEMTLLDGSTSMYYTYHYHDQRSYARVGIDLQSLKVFSDKIDGDLFEHIVPAAYVLHALYATGMYAYTPDVYPKSTPAATVWIAGWIYGWLYPAELAVGWLNSILGEQFCNLHCDMWRQFEVSRQERLLRWDNLGEWIDMKSPYYSGQSCMETMMVCGKLSVNPEVTRPQPPSDGQIQFLYIIGLIYQQIQEYRDSSTLPEDEQIDLLTRMWNEFFYTRKVDMDIPGGDDRHLHRMREVASICNQPVLIIKAVAEIYNRDFWELWEPVSEAGNSGRVLEDIRPVENITTAEFLDINPDELIYLWTAEHPITFSKELEQWFRSRRRQYNRLLHENWSYERPIYRIYKVLHDAEQNYGEILAFQSCLEESIDHIDDRRYLTLWRMFERMIYSRRMLDSMDGIRVEGGFNNKHNQWRDHPTRRQLRHYLALIANKELRRTVFGF